MNRVGVVTLTPNRNFGGILQIYAITRLIESLGYQAEVLNYRRKDIALIGSLDKMRIRENSEGLIHYLIKSRLLHCLKKQQHEAFERFEQQHIKMSDVIYRKMSDFTNERMERYQAFVCGSDQIWNPQMVGLDPVFFLRFSRNTHKNIAYAPSLGIQNVEPEEQMQLRELLPLIGRISVREESGREILKECGQEDVRVVLDPSLALNPREWHALVRSSTRRRRVGEPYAILYAFGDQRFSRELSKRVCRDLGYKLVVIGHAPTNCIDNPLKVVFNVGPIDFLHLIFGASLVITNSFHATAFSIISETPFLATPRVAPDEKNLNSRISDLLCILGLGDAKLSDLCEFNTLPVYDWDNVRQRLAQARDESVTFLSEALTKAMMA